MPTATCFIAAEHSLTIKILKSGGGILRRHTDEILFPPPGNLLSGYRSCEKYGKAEIICRDDVRNRIQSGLDGSKRVWLISGDGTENDIQMPTGVISVIEES